MTQLKTRIPELLPLSLSKIQGAVSVSTTRGRSRRGSLGGTVGTSPYATTIDKSASFRGGTDSYFEGLGRAQDPLLRV